MNISEAQDVATLLRVVQADQGDARSRLDPETVVNAATRLAERVHKALMAGPQVSPNLVRRTMGDLGYGRAFGRSYSLGLPVVVTVDDSGVVSYEIDTSEAGEGILDDPESEDDLAQRRLDANSTDRDHAQRRGIQ